MAKVEPQQNLEEVPFERPDTPREGQQPYSSETEDYQAHDVTKPPPDTESKRDHGRRQ
jgi:hypothetical protein